MKNKQLVVVYPELDEEKGRVPIEDIAILILDHKRITISSPLLEALMENSTAVVVCNSQHHPNGLMLPLDGHSELTEHWRCQINASAPLKKQLWKQTHKVNEQFETNSQLFLSLSLLPPRFF